MPYNTSAILRRNETTGSTQLPVSRVKKMIALDTDIHMCSSNATFVITLATEMFIQYMAEQGHNVVKSERKPRRNIQYRDLSSAVSRLDNLEFLSDVVPRTVPFKAIKEKKAPPQIAALTSQPTNGEASGSGTMESGQMTLDGMRPMVNGMNGSGIHDHGEAALNDPDDEAAEDPNTQLQIEIGRADVAGEINGHQAGSLQDSEMGQ